MTLRFVKHHQLPGTLYLHSMPGRFEPYAEFEAEIARREISAIVCLTGRAEMEKKSPLYAAAVAAGSVPVTQFRHVPVVDFGIPATAEEKRALTEAARTTVTDLKAGRNVLVHCGYGHGRTGMFAIAVFLCAGMELHSATALVAASGSAPEKDVQRAFLRSLMT